MATGALSTRAAERHRLRLLVAGVAALGLVCAGTALFEALQAADQPGPLRVAAAVLLVALGDISLLRVRIGGDGNSFNWAEAALIIAAWLVGWPWLIALGGVGVLLRQLLARRAAVKAVYNAAAFASGAALGRAGYAAVTGSWQLPGVTSWRTWVGLAVAAIVVYFLWNSVLVALAVSLHQGIGLRQVWQTGSALRLLTLVGNTTAGVAVVAGHGGHDDVRTALVITFLLLVLYLSYTSFCRAQQERDTWRDLQSAAADLNRVSRAAVLAAAERGARRLFGASSVLVVPADDPALSALAGQVPRDEPLVVEPETSDAGARAGLGRLGLRRAVLATLDGSDGPLGFLLLGFEERVQLHRRERPVLITYAGQVAAALRQAELFEQMQDQRTRLSAIVDNASDGIFLLGRDGTVGAWNAAMARLTGCPAAAAVGRPLAAALPARTEGGDALSGDDVLAALDPAGPQVLPVRLRPDSALPRDLELSVAAVPSGGGPAGHAVVLTRDVTAQRELEQAKQDFVATVSHELRTPLTPIKGWLAVLQRPDFSPGEDQRREIIGQLSRQADALERLVEDLLSVSRFARGHFAVEPVPAAVAPVVAAAVADLGPDLPRPVQVAPVPADLVALVDPDRLRQVLANLLSNGDKYSPPDLPLAVTVGATADQVQIAVRDHGPGVPAALREAVFEPFRRLGSPLTRETRGTGLGLHIARSLVEAMAGSIRVEDAAPGARFVVAVPRVRRPVAAAVPAAPGPRPAPADPDRAGRLG